MQRIKQIAAFIVAGVLGVAAAQGSLTGTNVTGSVTFNTGSGPGPNYFDAANNGATFGVPATGYLNSGGATTVSISTTVPEFGFNDQPVLGVGNLIRADFGSSTLLINDVVTGNVVTTQYIFTDPAFSGLAVSESSDTFPGGMTVSLAGTTVTINFAGTAIGGNYNAVYVFAPVPEPTFLGLGGLALFGLIRRRRSAI